MRIQLIPRERRFYELFSEHVATISAAIAILREAAPDVRALGDARPRIKALEHEGDEITHELVRTLNKTFVTPFDREDIYSLISALDDILDYVEEIGDTISLYDIRVVPGAAIEMLGYLVAAIGELEQQVAKLESQRGGEPHGIEIHRLENLGDQVSRRAIAELFSGAYETLDVIKLKDLYALLEDALDRCEDVANIIESIVIKNA